jgi:uncharacterized repeat protein (TIGR03803 family)
VYKVTSKGVESILHSFSHGADGGDPFAGLLRDASGNMYGTTGWGGNNDYGVVFQLNTKGKENVLYAFTGPPDGNEPFGNVIRDSQGNLYGTTYWGGDTTCYSNGCGTVYEVSPQSDGTWKEKVLHAFAGGTNDGQGPFLEVLAMDGQGNLYGTTQYGGSGGDACAPFGGCGTVFKIDTAGNETILYNFTGQADGGWPAGNLILDADGDLYGTTGQGGDLSCGTVGCGTVFKLDKAGNLSALHTFQGHEGAFPSNLLRMANGTFYGTTAQGGAESAGRAVEWCINSSLSPPFHKYGHVFG